MRAVRRLIQLGVFLFVVWFGFLFVFSQVYPVADRVREAAQLKMEEHHTTFLPLDQIPLSYQLSVIETEDRRFYEHFGIDIWGIGRSVFTNIQTDELSEGGSTITQQLVRNTLLTPSKTWQRKLKEMVLAVALERFMSKQEILDLYINVIYYGHGAYGAGEAAQVYFGKPLSSLSLPEWSLLAGLPNAPSVYDPYKSLKLAKERQWQVLTNLVDTGQISQQEAQTAFAAPLTLH